MFRPTSLLNPDESQPFSGTSAVSSDVHAISISFGAYAVDTVRLGRHFDVIGGLRLGSLRHRLQLAIADGGLRRNSAASTSSRAIAPRFVYKPMNYGSVYFEYGTSFNPSAETLALSAGTADLSPEKNRTYEVGTKWDLPSKRLSVDAAVFQTTKENARETSPTNPLLVVLAGTQRVNGFQVSVTGRITDQWQLLSSYAYLDGKVIGIAIFPGGDRRATRERSEKHVQRMDDLHPAVAFHQRAPARSLSTAAQRVRPCRSIQRPA